MQMGATRSVARSANSQFLYGILIAIAILVVTGAVLAFDTLAGAPGFPSPSAGSGAARVGDDVATSFGVVAVEHVDRVVGPTAKALGGVTHGIHSLVPPDEVQIQTAATLTNRLDHPIRYSPEQFALRVGRRRRSVRALSSSVLPGTLQPDASIDVTLSFIAPRDGSRMWMSYEDPGRSPPIVIDLGRLPAAPRSPSPGFHHHH